MSYVYPVLSYSNLRIVNYFQGPLYRQFAVDQMSCLFPGLANEMFVQLEPSEQILKSIVLVQFSVEGVQSFLGREMGWSIRRRFGG